MENYLLGYDLAARSQQKHTHNRLMTLELILFLPVLRRLPVHYRLAVIHFRVSRANCPVLAALVAQRPYTRGAFGPPPTAHRSRTWSLPTASQVAAAGPAE